MTSINDNNALNMGHLREKLISEYRFISSVLERVPFIYSQEIEGDNNEDASATSANMIVSKSGDASRACTAEELQARLDVLKSKQKPGNLPKKRSLETKLKNKKKKEEKMAKLRLEKMKLLNKGVKRGRDQSGSADNLPEGKRSKPVFNSEGKMVFSKFDFSDVGSLSETKKKKKEIKDPKKILEKLKLKKETIKQLKDTGRNEEVTELVKKDAWSNALKKAEGVKVRDDPELLKKSIKRQELQKKSSAKKWASREAGVKKKLKERVDKREGNLQARKDSKKQKKRASAIKKGRIVPGF